MCIVPLSGQYNKPNLPKLCICIYEVFYIFKRLNTLILGDQLNMLNTWYPRV